MIRSAMDDGEVSDQDSVEEISGCEFKPFERNSKKKSSMMMMISVGDEGYCVSGNAASCLFSLAWAQAVQGKHLNDTSDSDDCVKGSEADPMVVDDESEKSEEEGELENGEIDFDVTEECIDSGGEKEEDLRDGVEMEVEDEEAEAEEVVWIRQTIEKITLGEAERSFRLVCHLLKLSLRRLGRVYHQCRVHIKDSLVGKTFSAIGCVCLVFNSMSPVLKEQNKATISTLLSYALSTEPVLFSLEQKKEIEAAMVAVEVSTTEEQTTVFENPVEFTVIDQAIQTDSIALTIVDKAIPTDSIAPVAGARNNLVSSEKYILNHGIDVENMEVVSENLLIQPYEAYEAYEAVAVRAVSSYQKKFSRAMFSSGDRLSSPTPSGEGETEEADGTGNEVSCFRTSDNISTVPRVPLRDSLMTSSNIISQIVPEVIKSSNAGVGAPACSPPSRPFPFTNSKVKNKFSSLTRSKLEPVSEALSLKNNMTALVPSVDGPALKKQRTGPEKSLDSVEKNETRTSSRTQDLGNGSLLRAKRGCPTEQINREPKTSPLRVIDMPPSVTSRSHEPISPATGEKPNGLAQVPSPAPVTDDHVAAHMEHQHAPLENGCSGVQNYAKVEAPPRPTQGVNEKQDSHELVNGAKSRAALSQFAVLPDMALPLNGSIMVIGGINTQTATSLKCGEGANPTQSPDCWGSIEHISGRLNDQQKAVFQQERTRRIEEQKKMFAARKLSLVLDLDHTLLNSALFSDIDPDLDEILRMKEQRDRKRPKRQLFRFPHLRMWTKLRPGIWNFLEKASKLYELHLCTMGNKKYADEIVKVLDPTGALFAGRVISRGVDKDSFECEEIAPKCKDLDGVMGMESAVIIIDDTVCVWPHNKRNLIAMDRYLFFPSGRRQLGCSGTSLLERDHDERPEDNALASALTVIERIHRNFFSNKSLDGMDVRSFLAYEKRKILAGCRVVFSGIFHLGERNPHLCYHWQRAEEFGAVCTYEVDEQVTHVVANKDGTEKVKWALSTGRHVVKPGWLEASALLFRRMDERDFAIEHRKTPTP